jgi:hypothetical protein
MEKPKADYVFEGAAVLSPSGRADTPDVATGRREER